jgi:putative transposase
MPHSRHRKTVRHYHEPGHLHELTFSCYRRLPLLTNDSWQFELARSIDRAGEAAQIDLLAFVFMPEHVHLLVQSQVPTAAISSYLAKIKRPFSTWVKGKLRPESPLMERLVVRERPGKVAFRFWQEGPGFDRNLFSAIAIRASIEYIHNNPVKRGLCRAPTDWKWSSARHYLLTSPSHADLPAIGTLPEGCFS